MAQNTGSKGEVKQSCDNWESTGLWCYNNETRTVQTGSA